MLLGLYSILLRLYSPSRQIYLLLVRLQGKQSAGSHQTYNSIEARTHTELSRQRKREERVSFLSACIYLSSTIYRSPITIYHNTACSLAFFLFPEPLRCHYIDVQKTTDNSIWAAAGLQRGPIYQPFSPLTKFSDSTLGQWKLMLPDGAANGVESITRYPPNRAIYLSDCTVYVPLFVLSTSLFGFDPVPSAIKSLHCTPFYLLSNFILTFLNANIYTSTSIDFVRMVSYIYLWSILDKKFLIRKSLTEQNELFSTCHICLMHQNIIFQH